MIFQPLIFVANFLFLGDKNKKTVIYCFRNKQQNKFIKQLLRSLFKIKVKD